MYFELIELLLIQVSNTVGSETQELCFFTDLDDLSPDLQFFYWLDFKILGKPRYLKDVFFCSLMAFHHLETQNLPNEDVASIISILK